MIRRNLQRVLLIIALPIAVFVVRIQAEELPLDSDPVFTDEKDSPTAAEVALEVLRLQQQQGGSIVQDRPQLKNYATGRFPPHHHGMAPDTTLLAWPEEQGAQREAQAIWQSSSARQPPHPQVALLRETALLLDTRAHHLEELDLYDQADALRQIAMKLRKDARNLKRIAASAGH